MTKTSLTSLLTNSTNTSTASAKAVLNSVLLAKRLIGIINSLSEEDQKWFMGFDRDTPQVMSRFYEGKEWKMHIDSDGADTPMRLTIDDEPVLTVENECCVGCQVEEFFHRVLAHRDTMQSIASSKSKPNPNSPWAR